MRLIKLVLLSLVLTLPTQAFSAEDIRKITVTGKSETVVEAHYAIVQLSIRHVKKEMNQSHNELMKTISNLTGELKNIGLADADIKKSLILQGPEYSWEKDSSVLKGYYSECSVDLYVKISKLGDVYKGLANYKSVTIQGTDFKRNDEFDVRKAEFEKALQGARKKAEFMAETLNTKIGKVHSIQEVSSENYFTANVYANDFRSGVVNAGEAAKTGYGNIKISALVTVEFELE